LVVSVPVKKFAVARLPKLALLADTLPVTVKTLVDGSNVKLALAAKLLSTLY
jgi:hypothetical protein